MLVNANLKYSQIPLLSGLVTGGADPDFNQNWFKNVGGLIVSSM
jgi:hypothetical protein